MQLHLNDFLIYDTNTGALYFDADANGVGIQQQFATLTGIPELQTSNFSWFTI
jgi:Ca2+-binding RTX toxin-like protein